MSQALEDYGVNEIQELAEHFAIPLGVDADTVQAEWQAFKPELLKLTEGSTWQATYTSLKKICKGAPEANPAMEQLMDIKAVIIWATVCCESGFSKMKLAKGELQADMKTPMLDARLRIQMLGPQDPRKLTTAEKSALGRTGYNEKVKMYHTAVDDLVNKAITSWDPKKHNSALAIRQAANGSGKLGSSHAKKADAKDPNAALINTDVIGTVEQNILPDDEVPTKPPYLVLEDSIMIAPEPNLASVELSTLNGVVLALFFEYKNDYGGHLRWEAFITTRREKSANGTAHQKRPQRSRPQSATAKAAPQPKANAATHERAGPVAERAAVGSMVQSRARSTSPRERTTRAGKTAVAKAAAAARAVQLQATHDIIARNAALTTAAAGPTAAERLEALRARLRARGGP